MSIKEVRYQLTSSIEYAHATQGACVGTFVTLAGPSISHIGHIAPLRQYFMRATMDLAQRFASTGEEKPSDDNAKDATLDAESIIGVLQGSEVPMDKVIASFKHLMLTTKLIKLEGETEFTALLFDQLSIDDFYGLMGTYYANFIIASQMK